MGMFGIGDVLVHTWGVARKTGRDEALDAEEVHRLLTSMQPRDEVMRRSGASGPGSMRPTTPTSGRGRWRSPAVDLASPAPGARDPQRGASRPGRPGIMGAWRRSSPCTP